MTTTNSKNIPIDVIPGVCPDTDCTNTVTPHWTAADKIRFVKGRPQKIDGWKKAIMNGVTISGCVRTIFSAQLDEKLQTILGSNGGLYALVGSNLSNITPLQTATVAIANSIDTHYATLANNPVTTSSGSDEVVIADVDAAFFKEGDVYTLSGSTAVGGITVLQLNKDHIVRSIGSGTVTINVAATASSTATGGGASVVRTSGLITITDTAHGQANDDRVKITAATATGGIDAGEINVEFEIRNVTTNTFDVMTIGTATSSVSAGGGAGTEYQQQIADGLCDETAGQGYGMAKYGTGLYGTALVSSTGKRYPRIWFCDTFGDNILATAGNESAVYTWAASLGTAPEAIANAPTDVNYAFVSNNILVTFGSGQRNRIKASDQGNVTTWTSSSTNQVYTDDIEGAGRLSSHVSLNGTNLIFTENQCYTFRYIGLPLVWAVDFKDNIGIISPMARVVVKGVAYWMGQNNFYEWRGGNVEVMKSNNGGNETTLLNYIFKNINRAQLSKCFAWYNKRYDEIWFHYPSAGSTEVDRVARYHVTEKHWTPDTFDRLAAEYPNISLQFPRLINAAGELFLHETGNDDDTAAMAWSLTSNMRNFGTNNVYEPQIIPDSVQSGDINVYAESYSYPQSATPKNTKNITISPDTPFSPLGVDGRFIKYTFSGEALDQQWIMGAWEETIQTSSRSQ